ncbi:hypothetical protein AURDEDRAFT_189092, partial [Auricularia subglabra TFB-10046 SS5]
MIIWPIGIPTGVAARAAVRVTARRFPTGFDTPFHAPTTRTPPQHRSTSCLHLQAPKKLYDPAPKPPCPAIFRRGHFRPSGEHHDGFEAARPREPSPGSSSSENVSRTIVPLFSASLAKIGAFFFPLATAAGDRARSAPSPPLS